MEIPTCVKFYDDGPVKHVFLFGDRQCLCGEHYVVISFAEFLEDRFMNGDRSTPEPRGIFHGTLVKK